MPTYEYACDACDHHFELFQSITARAVRKCPKCGERKVRRLLGTGAGFLFRGSGFYETDYRSESYKKQARAEKQGESGSGKSGSDGAAGGSKKGKKTEDGPSGGGNQRA